jgi:tRNA (mo5U34)-methyltransferase
VGNLGIWAVSSDAVRDIAREGEPLNPMMPHPFAPFPATVEQFIEYAHQFEQRVDGLKAAPPEKNRQWYPYNSMASMDALAPVLRDHFRAFRTAVECGAMLDIGCADGDLSYLFASLGCGVTAIDMAASNYNWLAGVRALGERLDLPVEIREMNVDSAFDLEKESYGLVFLLGILYHLKNPFHVLETLARKARYCLLSTRIAARTSSGTLMRDEPLAYLLDHREANDDPTNYWIFSREGLLRLAKRTGWRVIGWHAVGTRDSNPAAPDADERMFVFLRSQLCSAPALVTLTGGFTEPLPQHWAWTEKRFSFEVRLAETRRPDSFLLGFVIPTAISDVSPVTLRCTVNGHAAGTEVFTGHGDKLFEKAYPADVDHTQPMRFEFTVEHTFSAPPDPRDLGVIMPFTGAISGIGAPILFWVD